MDGIADCRVYQEYRIRLSSPDQHSSPSSLSVQISDEPPDLASIPEENLMPRVYHRERYYRPRTPMTSPIPDDWGTSHQGGIDFDHEEIASLGSRRIISYPRQRHDGTAFLDHIRGNELI